ncbi:MAG: FAD-dependent oxidoreductase [Planctomycetes bacterium]|nr:FAD-dependent oxidoreductase [Planctomycetota bacterium]
MSSILIATLFLLGIGLVAAMILTVAARVFHVHEDPRIIEVEDALLGANCGACGHPGCAAAAEAVVRGKAGPNVCVAGGYEIAQAVAEVMGLEAEQVEPRKAVLGCRYSADKAALQYIYNGAHDCRAAVLLYGGAKECMIGCLGLGTCERLCPFGAIHMGKGGLPVVNERLCTGCGICVDCCPTHVLRLESISERLRRFHTVEDCLAPCRQACPAQIDIAAYIDHIRNGRYLAAVETIKERNPLPLTCGRVCPHPCEMECRRLSVDEAVAINHLKRFAADYERESGKHLKPYIAPNTGKRIAVIGGGPAGLSCAYYLRRMGHTPEIFDAQPKLGGMLRYGIPEFRLPGKALDWEIEGILALGIETHTETVLGKDVTLQGLRDDGFDAVFLALGAWTSMSLGVEGDDLPGVMAGVDFLARQAAGDSPPLGERVVVVGGGNTAIDAARTCLRCGCGEVVILYRRSREEMPANDREVEETEREGARLHFLAAPSKLIAGADGKLAKLEYIQMELGEPDESGRRRPVPAPGSETVMEVGNIIAAIGQRPDVNFDADAPDDLKIGATRWDTLEADERTLQTNVPFIFTGGDVYTGPQTVVQAIAAGRRAARSIHLYVTGQEVAPPPGELREAVPCPPPDASDIPLSPRAEMPARSVEERLRGFQEVETGLSETAARREAQRCLQCGRICYRVGTQDIFSSAG